MTTRYNHAFSFAFSVDAADPTGDHIPVAELRGTLIKKLAAMSDNELLENLGAAFDTYEHSVEAEEVRS